jgi:hypothetical protein
LTPITPTRATFTAIPEAAYSVLYKDFGAGYFGDFSIDFDYNISATTHTLFTDMVTLAMVVNGPGSWREMLSLNRGIGYGLVIKTFSLEVRCYCPINGQSSDTVNVFGGAGTYTTPGTVYGRFTRVGTLATAYVYSDGTRTALLQSTSITVPTTTFQHFMAFNNRNLIAGTLTTTGFCENYVV